MNAVMIALSQIRHRAEQIVGQRQRLLAMSAGDTVTQAWVLVVTEVQVETLRRAYRIARETTIKRTVAYDGIDSRGPLGRDVGSVEPLSPSTQYRYSFPLGAESQMRVRDCLRAQVLVGLADPSALVPSADVVVQPSLEDELAVTDTLRENDECRRLGGRDRLRAGRTFDAAAELVGGLYRKWDGSVVLVAPHRSKIAWAPDDDLVHFAMAPTPADREDVDLEDLTEGLDYTFDPAVRNVPLIVGFTLMGNPIWQARRQAPVAIGNVHIRAAVTMADGALLWDPKEQVELERERWDDLEVEREGAGQIEEFADPTYDPQLAGNPRLVVKRSTHRKPSWARPLAAMIPSPAQQEQVALDRLREQVEGEVGEVLYREGRIEDAYTIWERGSDTTLLIPGVEDAVLTEAPAKVWYAELDRLALWMAHWRSRRRDAVWPAWERVETAPGLAVLHQRNLDAWRNRFRDRLVGFDPLG